MGEGGRKRVAEHFERSANLPGVVKALVGAGVIPADALKEPSLLRAVA